MAEDPGESGDERDERDESAEAGEGGKRVEDEGPKAFVRDAAHWLFKFSPDEWIRAALGELRRAEEAYAQRNARGGLAGARRGAGMALNGLLIVEPNDGWGRSYVDHLLALSREEGVPPRVREAAKLLVETPLPGQGSLVAIRTASSDHKVLEAARDIAAHAYAVVKRHEGGASR